MLFVRSAHSLKDHHHNNACDRTAGSDDEGREHEVDIVYGNVLIIACNQGGDYRGQPETQKYHPIVGCHMFGPEKVGGQRRKSA